MSQPVNQTSLGTSFIINGLPASADEFDEMSGEVGACVASANDDYIKHSWLTKFRTKLIDLLVEETGFEREVVSKRKTKSGEVDVYEKDTRYMERLLADRGGEASQFNELAQRAADLVPVDLKGVTSGGRIGKVYLTQADELIEKVTAAGSDFTKFVSYIQAGIPAFQFVLDAEGNPTRDSIAFAIRADEERVRSEAAKQRAASMV